MFNNMKRYREFCIAGVWKNYFWGLGVKGNKWKAHDAPGVQGAFVRQ